MSEKLRTMGYNTQINNEFFRVLKSRVNSYFKENKISKKGGAKMWGKVIFSIGMYVAPFILLFTPVNFAWYMTVALFAMMGLGMSFIGLEIMHDSNHGSLSKRKWVNELLGKSLNLLGGNAEIWKIQHNQMHHTHTNIEGLDPDIEGHRWLRLNPSSEKKKIHRYQHIYGWFMYCLMTVSWITSHEFKLVKRFNENGVFKSAADKNKVLWQLIFWKLVYYALTLVLPLVFIAPWWGVLIGFFLMHGIAGLFLSSVFQSAHVVPDSIYSEQEKDGIIQNNWFAHQLSNTSNFAVKSKWFTWLVGGLNFQIEHHLFPNISHIHYPAISKLVRQTALEFQQPYNVESTFWSAIRNHGKMLKLLGR